MARESLGCSTPYDEECAQVGEEGYRERAMGEIRRLREGLEILFPPPEGARFRTESNGHDFGTYYELGVVFDDERDDHLTWYEEIEEGIPATWKELDERVQRLQTTIRFQQENKAYDKEQSGK
jgi:hypothetical protein